MPRKAALRASPAVDEPNVIIPLASSYNERGIAGYTHTVTNSEDQRKINCFYELAKNAATGKGTLTLSKRPGVTINSSGNVYGTSTQSVYLVFTQPLSLAIGKSVDSVPAWVVSIVGTDIKVYTASTNVTLEATGATYIPSYADRTIISSVENVVVQLRPLNLSSPHHVYYAPALASFSIISDADFTSLVHRGKMEHMDGYAFIMDWNNLIWNSDINSIANWTATSFIAKQATQDAPVGLAKLGKQIIAFGEDTLEPFYNGGNTTGSPLLPIRQNASRTGLVSPRAQAGGGHYYCTIGDRIYFVGRQSGGIRSVGVFSYNGSIVEKVSTPYIDKILSQLSASTTAFSSVNDIGFNGQKAVSILLTAANDANPNWLMFFPDWKEWFEWKSTIFSPVNGGEFFIGCATNNKASIYNFTSADNWQDNGTSYPWSTQFKLPTNGATRKFMPMYGVDADTDSTTNDLTVEISTDDSQTFSTLGTIPLNQDRKVLFRGGSFRKAHIRLGNTNARPTRIHNFLARIE